MTYPRAESTCSSGSQTPVHSAAPSEEEAVKKCIYDAFFFWLSIIEFREKELSME